MNILHHKSWHVRNRDNILRVRKDEAKAAAEEKEKQKRHEIAESEKRLEILRSKLGKEGSKSKLVEYDQFLNQTHVNLFEQEEQGKHNEDKNAEAELDKKLEKEKFEKKIGLLKYLVDDELDLKVQPWYKTVRDKNYDDDIDKNREVDLKTKLKMDPLVTMNALMKTKKAKKHKHSDKKDISSKRKEKSIKLAANSSPETLIKTSNPKTIEQLRAERLKRESDERIKAQRLLSGNKDDGKLKEKIEVDDRKRKYNNQFNPDYAKF